MAPKFSPVVLAAKKLSRLWIINLLCLVLFWTQAHSQTSNVTIAVTIEEERPAGTEICDLMSHPDFQAILNQEDTAPPDTVTTDANANANDPNANGFDGPSAIPASPRLHFSIITAANPSSKYFSVGESSGLVVTTRKVDREQVCSFQKGACRLAFVVAARSVYGTIFELVNVQVTVEDVNDNAPEFGQSEFELFIPENSDEGRSFQLPTAFDRDTGWGNGVQSYRLLSDEILFSLEAFDTPSNTSDVFVTLESTVNRETEPAYTVLVGAIDGGVPPLTGTLTVQVRISDINDNFPVFEKNVYAISIAEDQGLDHPIVQTKASDADEGNNGQLVYSFSPWQPPAHLAFFRIDNQTGDIFLTRSLESQTGRQLKLIVQARDKGHPPKVSQCTVQIYVEDTINSMPEIIIDTLGGTREMTDVSEYAKLGKVLLHVSVRDSDIGDNGRTSCQVDSPEFQLQHLGMKDKYKIVLKAALDRETTELYNVTLSCEDHGKPSLLATKEFAVRVQDENDNPPIFSHKTYETSMYENNTHGAPIIQLTVTDSDIGLNAQIDYTVVGINRKYFTINGDGLMMAATSLDRELSSRMIAKIVAKDRGYPSLTGSTTVVVDLQDVNDMPPVFSQSVYHLEVEEEQKPGRYVGIVSATDQDLGENRRISYYIDDRSGDSDNFVVGVEGGVIKTNAILDREVKDAHTIMVRAVDHGVPSLTGSAKVIIRLKDVNDNLPYFLFPNADNDTLVIPHSLEADKTIVHIRAHDNDTGPNGQLMYSLSSVNETSPFAIHPSTGALYLDRSMATEDTGLYTLALVASDKGRKHQWATQALLWVDVYFDNSTLLAVVDSAGPGKAIITALIALGAVILLAFIIVAIFFCIKRYDKRKSDASSFPVSASSSSTTKLHSGYYIAPGVQESSSSIFGKHMGRGNGVDNQLDSPEGDHNGNPNGNPYVVMLQNQRPDVRPAEIVEIGHGSRLRLNHTFNSVDFDPTGDDGQFSTFRSDRQHNSLRRPSVDTCEKRANRTFDHDDLSCDDDSTSDSGRGGSDVDVNGASKAKARAATATPVSVKSGISDRLSPLPGDKSKGTFFTFRGESPSSYRFDSDSDTTLTRPSQRSAFKPLPMIASPGEVRHGDQQRTPRHSESDTDSSDLHLPAGGGRLPAPGPQTPTVAGIYSPHSGAYGGDRVTFRQPYKVAPLPLFMPPSSMPPSMTPSSSSSQHRSESEAEHSDAGSNRSSSSRRNYVPRLPLYPGIEFSHHAYGGSNRNSIGAFSNISSASNRDGFPTDPSDGSSNFPGANNYNYRNNRPYSVANDSSLSSANSTLENSPRLPEEEVSSTDPRVSRNYGNVISELETSRPVSIMDDEFLLPPYPQAEGEEERNNLLVQPGLTGYDTTPERDRERDALVPRSHYESSA